MISDWTPKDRAEFIAECERLERLWIIACKRVVFWCGVLIMFLFLLR